VQWNSKGYNKLFKSKNTRKLAFNFANYGIFQTINYLIPLIIIPYIVRVIGVRNFGILSFAQAIVYYYSIIVEYGFSITGVQMVAYSKNDSKKCSEIVSAIFMIQLALVLTGLLALILAALVFEEIKAYFWVYFFTYLMIPAQILMALWFYVGREEMQFLNFVNLIGRLIFLGAVFGVIRKESDFVLVPLVNSSAMFISGLVSLGFIIKKFKLTILFVSSPVIKKYLQEGWHIFISNFAINLYRNANVLILGMVASKEAVGLYSAGEKLVKAIQSIFTPLTQTFFPYISRLKMTNATKSQKAIKVLLMVMLVMATVITGLVIIFARPLTLLFLGAKFLATQKIIQIGAFVIVLGVINYILGIIFMTNFGMKAQFTSSVIITGIANFILCLILSLRWAEIGAAVAFTSAEVFLFALLLYFIFTNRTKWQITHA
jgi:PST family polysaccharide transporter